MRPFTAGCLIGCVGTPGHAAMRGHWRLHISTLLTRLSTTQNVKLRDLAAELVLTRRLPRNTG